MVIQVANTIAGFALAAPKLKEIGAREQIEKAEAALLPYLKMIGVIELILGIVALIERISIASFYVPAFGSSFPQAFAALALGLILASSVVEDIQALRSTVATLKENAMWVGIIGMAVGLGSILFGCPLCVF